MERVRMNPVCSSLTTSFTQDCILFATALETMLMSEFRRVIGHQFVRYCLSMSFFFTSVMTPVLCCSEKNPESRENSEHSIN